MTSQTEIDGLQGGGEKFFPWHIILQQEKGFLLSEGLWEVQLLLLDLTKAVLSINIFSPNLPIHDGVYRNPHNHYLQLYD